jgi:hypothetical protein
MRTAGLALLLAAVVASQPGAQQPDGPRSLDYETFKTRVQPILMAARKGNARCLSCHSRGGGNSYLEPLAPDATSYTDQQTRRNFERVMKLVVPGEPLKSILLTNPLAEEAGGSHWHGGGKHWQSQDNPEWRTLAEWVRSPSAIVPGTPSRVAASSPSGVATSRLDFSVYRSKVEPILMAPRKGNARCLSCHSRGGGNTYLEPLPEGATAYTEEQSRRNFERVSKLVTPGDPLKSILLTNPLAEDAGGSHWHGGGKHWQSQSNPEWQTLSAWVKGAAS